MSGERRTNSSVGMESKRTTTQQCNYRYRDAKAALCMCLMHADGDKQRGCTNFWSFVVLQRCLYRDGLLCGELDGTEMLQRVRGRSWLRCTRNSCETGTVSAVPALTNFGPTALENKKNSQSSIGGTPRGEAVNVFSAKSLRKATVVPSAKCDGCVSCSKARRNEVHSTTHWVLAFGFIPTALAAAPRWLVCSTNASRLRNCSLLAARNTRTSIHVHPRKELDSVKVCIKSNCSAVLKDDKAPEIRTAALLISVSVHQAHA